MTHYYLLIVAGEEIDETTRFFKIAVGSGAADVAGIPAMKALAAAHHWYFAKYSHETTDFLLKISLSLSRQPDDLNMTHLPIRKFLSAWKKFCKMQERPSSSSQEASHGRKKRDFSAKKVPPRVIQHAEARVRNKPKLIVVEFYRYLNSVL